MTADKKAQKAADAKFRALMNGDLRHVQVKPADRITLIGNASDLHGSVCTCCARRAGAA